MSLHEIEIAAVVAVAIILCRFRGLRCRKFKPLAANATSLKMKMQSALKFLRVVAPNASEHEQFIRVPGL